ncbi:MAG: hypothetical protein ACLRWP_15265 [Bilophila wadsworthia]
MGRMPNSWVSGRQTQLNIWPLCAEHDGQCEAGDEGEDGAHGSPGQPCRQQRESAAFRE